MKRTIILLSSVIALILLILAIVSVMLIPRLFAPREAISAEVFTAIMTNEGHAVGDYTYRHYDSFGIEIIRIAKVGDFNVEFYVFESSESARFLYAQLQQALIDSSGSAASSRSINNVSFNRFTQATEGRFEVLSRIENTLIAIDTTIENRTDVETILSILGY